MTVECVIQASNVETCVMAVEATMQGVGPFSIVWLWLGDNMASIIAVCAMGITFWQGWLSKKHNKLSVKPHLTINSYYNDRAEFQIVINLDSNGIGPAEIESHEILLDNKKLDISDVHSTIKQLEGVFLPTFRFFNKEGKEVFIKDRPQNDYLLSHSFHALEPKEVIGVDKSIPMIRLGFHDEKLSKVDLDTIEAAKIAKSRLKIKIRYKSSYGDSYTANI
ncbi:MAG: hypothetical protein GY843_15290 [Neptuniibacter sp.]|nr:hypothetical protein [Neptuniibacter sp.]